MGYVTPGTTRISSRKFNADRGVSLAAVATQVHAATDADTGFRLATILRLYLAGLSAEAYPGRGILGLGPPGSQLVLFLGA